MTDMLRDLETFIKVVVDVRRGVMAGGGEMHADGESLLLADGSVQEDLWGANYVPESREVRFEALINIRPRQGNRGMRIEDRETRARMEPLIRHILEGAP